ncbi:MAG: AbrB/MazE/SpoVT family DNA-binding domain-containing protein [Deltaproteobacteria bacterium]|nr:MAG: AbrB/MazE/SpoVT family DNA-binding domain-containing protein [Deltaproteobacteria bacterium]
MASQPSHLAPIPIDQAGRIVLPKAIREHLGVRAGTQFEVTEEANRIILTPIIEEATITSKKGVLVVTPESSPSDNEALNIVKKQRQARNSKFL